MIKFLSGVGITLLFILCIYYYRESQTLNSIISTLKQDNRIITNENFQKVKESYYIEQQNRDTNLILFTVTALIALFSATTFIGVKSEFKTNVAKIENNYNAQVAEYQKSVVHITSLEGDLSFEVGKNLANTVEAYKIQYTKEELVTVFETILLACNYYAKSLLYKENIHPNFKNPVISI